MDTCTSTYASFSLCRSRRPLVAAPWQGWPQWWFSLRLFFEFLFELLLDLIVAAGACPVLLVVSGVDSPGAPRDTPSPRICKCCMLACYLVYMHGFLAKLCAPPAAFILRSGCISNSVLTWKCASRHNGVCEAPE